MVYITLFTGFYTSQLVSRIFSINSTTGKYPDPSATWDPGSDTYISPGGVGEVLGPGRGFSSNLSYLKNEQSTTPRNTKLNPGGGFKYFLFSPLLGQDSHFD